MDFNSWLWYLVQDMTVSMKCQASIWRKWLQIQRNALNEIMFVQCCHVWFWKLCIVKLYHTRSDLRYQIIVIFIILNTYMHSVQCSSVTQLCPTLCEPMDNSTPGLPVRHQLSKLSQTHLHWDVMPSNLLILCHLLLLLPSIFPSIRVF